MSTSTAERYRLLALRAFPLRWRENHGEELLYVSSQLASSSHHAEWRELVDIVRGGLAMRIHDRPPLQVRARYRWLTKPVPPKWHGWMRDDLRSPWLGFRMALGPMVPLLLLVTVGSPGAVSTPSAALRNAGIFLAIMFALSPIKARQVRKHMNRELGYDIAAGPPLPPPPIYSAQPPPPAFAPEPQQPASRTPYGLYGTPLTVWSLVSGAALIAGAAASNAPDRSIAGATFTPDPNSPLSAQQVGTIAAIVAIAACLVAIATVLAARRRALRLGPTTAHASLDVSRCTAWTTTTIVGVPVTLIGALGMAPDLACAAIGSGLVLLGASAGAAAIVVARRDTELGRQISLAELLVGERDPSSQHSLRPTAVQR